MTRIEDIPPWKHQFLSDWKRNGAWVIGNAMVRINWKRNGAWVIGNAMVQTNNVSHMLFKAVNFIDGRFSINWQDNLKQSKEWIITGIETYICWQKCQVISITGNYLMPSWESPGIWLAIKTNWVIKGQGLPKNSTCWIKHGENLHIASWTVEQLSGKKRDPPRPKIASNSAQFHLFWAELVNGKQSIVKI